MGSVMSQEQCPRCGMLEMMNDFYYKTGEEYNFCPDCGYSSRISIKRDENHVAVKDENGEYVWIEHENKEPFGAYRIMGEKSGVSGTLVTEKDYDELVSHVVSITNQPNDVQSATVSRFVNGEIVVETLYGNENGKS